MLCPHCLFSWRRSWISAPLRRAICVCLSMLRPGRVLVVAGKRCRLSAIAAGYFFTQASEPPGKLLPACCEHWRFQEEFLQIGSGPKMSRPQSSRAVRIRGLCILALTNAGHDYSLDAECAMLPSPEPFGICPLRILDVPCCFLHICLHLGLRGLLIPVCVDSMGLSGSYLLSSSQNFAALNARPKMRRSGLWCMMAVMGAVQAGRLPHLALQEGISCQSRGPCSLRALCTSASAAPGQPACGQN